MKKVVKFGGSSLASAEQFKKVGSIIHADVERRFVVPSAPGKRHSKDTKVTDMLYECYNRAIAGQSTDSAFDKVKARFSDIMKKDFRRRPTKRKIRSCHFSFLGV